MVLRQGAHHGLSPVHPGVKRIAYWFRSLWSERGNLTANADASASASPSERMMFVVGGGAPVVVRGRESRPQGEGEQMLRRANSKEEQAVDTDYQTNEEWLLNIQRKLYTWSKDHPDEAWGDMWNWLTHPRNLHLAWQRVASNRGKHTPGVDGMTVRRIEQRIGVERFLNKLREHLRSGSYKPLPVRRILIPKRGKPGQSRPLGVPTVADRVVQAAILHLLEPIFEAGFYPCSYGFRPKKGCRDAIEHIRNAIKPRKQRSPDDRPAPPYQWVIEGDIKGCFDNIDHQQRHGARPTTRC